MNKKYCIVMNAVAAFRICYINHKHNDATKELTLTLKVENGSDSVELMNYVKYFSETVTGSKFSKQLLLSKIFIGDASYPIRFDNYILTGVHFPEIFVVSEQLPEYEVVLTFKRDFNAKRLYLSGPMSICKDEATWKANFQKYEDIFTEKGYIVVNPAKNEILPTYEECLKHSLQQEMECDCVFFMPNSILSTGARLEYEIAKACGLEIVLLDEDISFTNNYENNSGIKCKNK